MKLLTYILSLLLSVFTYFLFAAYLTVSAGLDSILPLVCFYCSIITFGVLSWLHFYRPRLGIIALTISTLVMFTTWPVFLAGDYFDGEGYKPALIEWLVPLTLTALTIGVGWMSIRKRGLNKIIMVVLAVPPLALALYVGVYFTIRYFW